MPYQPNGLYSECQFEGYQTLIDFGLRISDCGLKASNRRSEIRNYFFLDAFSSKPETPNRRLSSASKSVREQFLLRMRTRRWYTRSPTSRIKCSRPASPGSLAASTTSIDS